MRAEHLPIIVANWRPTLVGTTYEPYLNTYPL
jgi:hypothetical protein